jgi:hypothetical protein
MAAPFLNRNSVVLAKVESTYATDPVPVVATDAVLSTVPQISNEGTVLERLITVGTLSPTAHVIGRKLVNCSFGVEFKSQTAALDGVSSNPISLDDILRSAGFTPTYTVETAPPGSNDGFVIYAPRSTGLESATFYVFPGKEVRHKITGAYTDFSIDIPAGGYAMMSCSVKGIYNTPTDTTAGTPVTETDTPVAVTSIAAAFGAVSGLVIRNMNISMNNEIVERADVNSAEGFKGLRLAGRKPMLKFRMEKEAVATWDIYGAWSAGTSYNTTFTIGSTAGKKILVTMPKLVLSSVKESDDAGIVMLDVEALCARNSDAGNDELTFKFF